MAFLMMKGPNIKRNYSVDFGQSELKIQNLKKIAKLKETQVDLQSQKIHLIKFFTEKSHESYIFIRGEKSV